MKWNDLSMQEKSDLMAIAVKNGIYSLEEIKNTYNSFESNKYDIGGWINFLKETGRRIIDTEARRAEVYDPNKFTKDQAYADARSKGQKTFYYGTNYFNTNYSGEHHKQYERDVKSGKAAAWEKAYPGYTNPELRKAKQEELDTYGITNEQTRNKSFLDKKLKKMPATDYNLDFAISGMLGEHNPSIKYKTSKDLIEALYKKYPKFRGAPLEPLEDKFFIEATGSAGVKKGNNFDKFIDNLNVDEDSKKAFEDDISYYSNVFTNHSPIHGEELNFLLGYPKGTPVSNIKISKYRTGNTPYYYTTDFIEDSYPFIQNKEYIEKAKKEKEVVHEDPYYDPWDVIYKSVEDKGEDYWKNLGLEFSNNGPIIDLKTLFSKGTKEDIETAIKAELVNPDEDFDINQLEIGNNAAATKAGVGYYNTAKDYVGKYKDIAGLLSNMFNQETPDNKKAIVPNYRIHDNFLGNYTIGLPKDKSYISIYDIFDLNPFGAGKDESPITIGKPYEYYTRFYKDKTPDIDKMYLTFPHKNKKK